MNRGIVNNRKIYYVFVACCLVLASYFIFPLGVYERYSHNVRMVVPMVVYFFISIAFTNLVPGKSIVAWTMTVIFTAVGIFLRYEMDFKYMSFAVEYVAASAISYVMINSVYTVLIYMIIMSHRNKRLEDADDGEAEKPGDYDEPGKSGDDGEPGKSGDDGEIEEPGNDGEV